MKRYLLAATLILTHIAFGQVQPDSINTIIKREIAARRSKSIIIGIVDANGRKIFAGGRISDQDTSLPDANTIYEIGSITKVFTSLLLAEMSLQKRLDINDPVSKFLPRTVRPPARNGKEITLLSLSTNRSGLPRNASNIDPGDPCNPYADYTRKQLYEFISDFKPDRDVDERWQYSNIGYALLGDVLTIAGKKDYETLTAEYIFKPLNMTSTFLSPPRNPVHKTAQGYSEYMQPAGAWNFPLPGGGGLRSNVNDMLSFAAANLGLIKTDLFPAMEMTHILRAKKDGNDTYTTMGWTMSTDNGRCILFKDGGTGGYRTFLGIDKINKIGVVVLSNSNNPVTDIGWHILDSTHRIDPYHYPWALLDTLTVIAQTKGVDKAVELYRRLKTASNGSFIFNENQLDHLGDELRKNGKIKDAIKIYELNTEEYPKSARVYESLGETYKRSKKKKTAVIYFEKAAELDPQDPHLKFVLNKLKNGRA